MGYPGHPIKKKMVYPRSLFSFYDILYVLYILMEINELEVGSRGLNPGSSRGLQHLHCKILSKFVLFQHILMNFHP